MTKTRLDSEMETLIPVAGGGFDAAQPISFGAQMSEPQTDVDMVQTLQAKNPMAVAIQDVRAVEKQQNGRGWNDDGSAYTVDTHATQGVAVAQPVPYDFYQITAPVNRQNRKLGDPCHTLARDNAAHATIVQTMQVRRLTAVECERLQGFPDGYTNIPWRNKAESPDGPRYKALGNSMAVPVMRWIGKRINEVSKL